MESSQRRGWLVAAYGHRPRESSKYRLPLSIALLVSFIALVLFSADRGMDDLGFLAFGVYITCSSVGDRLWSVSLKSASWMRLAGAASLLLGAAAFATHLYLERAWIWLILALLVISVALIFWVQELGDRIQRASGDSTSE